TAEYRDGRLDLEIDNMSGATTVALAGSHRATKTAPASAFREAISLSEGVNRFSLDIGPTYDLGFTLDDGSSPSMDEVYVSDGAWGVVADAAGGSVESFFTEVGSAVGPGTVTRAARLSGTVRTWVAAFRFLRSGGRPADLSAYRSLVVAGHASHPVRLAFTWRDTDGMLRSHETRLAFDDGSAMVDLAGVSNDTRWLSGVTQLTFFLDGNGLVDERADMELASVQFSVEAATSTGAVRDGPTSSLSLGSPYPNPFTDRVHLPVGSSGGEFSGAVFDLIGRRVLEIPPTRSDHVMLEGSALAPGTYLVRLSDGFRTITHSILRTR
ncbi:MAG: T9SS type A sorting domain-containing protein, partial [Rhodothermales bacterium]|nr:T9SS type A sorting domain-containing protein [Rhodothermales bacterium]